MADFRQLLIVEDNPADVKLIQVCVQDASIPTNLKFFGKGIELIDFLRTNGVDDVDLVIMDLNMPGMDGVDALQIIRKELNALDLPVVIFSSSENQNDIYRSYQNGANAYVVKAIDFIDFQDRLLKMIHFWNKKNIAQLV